MASVKYAGVAVVVFLFAMTGVHSAGAEERKPGEVFTEGGGTYKMPSKAVGSTRDEENAFYGEDEFKYDATTGGANDDFSRRVRAGAAAEDKMQGILEGKVKSEPKPKLTAEGFQQLMQKAQNGDVVAFGEVARAYRYGEGVEKNQKKAVEWYEAAARRGQTQYYTAIGDLYREDSKEKGMFDALNSLAGNDVQKDNTIAREWYERGAGVNDSQSMLKLAVMHRDGLGGLEKNPDRARELHNNGLLRSETEQKLRMMQARKTLYDEAARTEGITYASEQTTAGSTAASQGQVASVGKASCAYVPSNITAEGFSAVYEANCSGEVGGDENTLVTVSSLQCQVQKTGTSNPTHRFYCNSGQKPDIMIGGIGCTLQAQGEGDALSYRALCAEALPGGITTVKHLGHDCTVASEGKDKHYLLDCPSAPARALTKNIGKFSCSLRPGAKVPGDNYKILYEAYCGGLTDEQKTGENIPSRIDVDSRNCTLTPAAPNPDKRDFDLDC